MSLTPNFTAVQSIGSPDSVQLTDSSTGSDGAIVSRRVSFRLSNGNYLTLMAWVNISSFGISEAFIHKDRHYTIAFYNNKQITYADSTNWSYANFGYHGSFTENVWYHIVAVKNSSNVKIYANNSIVVSKTFGSATLNDTYNYNLSIGGYTSVNTLSQAFHGKIANVKIYNRALSANEVEQNYNATKGRFGL